VVIESVVAAAAAAEVLRPANTQEIAVPVTILAAVVIVSTRLVELQARVPALKPLHVRVLVGFVAVSNVVPPKVTVLINPSVTVVKATVRLTPVVALTLTSDDNVAEAENIAAIDAPVITSASAGVADLVFMLPVVAAAAVDVRVKPVMVHSTAALIVAEVMVIVSKFDENVVVETVTTEHVAVGLATPEVKATGRFDTVMLVTAPPDVFPVKPTVTVVGVDTTLLDKAIEPVAYFPAIGVVIMSRSAEALVTILPVVCSAATAVTVNPVMVQVVKASAAPELAAVIVNKPPEKVGLVEE
jgi:hypothetical protein